MLIFPEMLIPAAKNAGIKIPPTDDKDMLPDYNKEQYPHFFVFCNAQLGTPILHWGAHFDNAKIIADIPEKDIRHVTHDDLLKRGWQL